ncbi:Catechol 2,3-dioxygenase [Seinonella peptonophila]|uniref:Catechol 2,3-dioxygenase n=1 Tax=Seinonella peptonophila TaxID=112248 RepID=A0A1M4VH46_9BACL|nr:VOC family protein [Seinonella peptonophila]SHE68207.1 Catechol 2,3-dioxygenase [Seinonella peptonophila]
MKLQHLNLCVTDITESQNFFENLFGFKTLARRGEATAVLNDDHGFTLVLSNPKAFGNEPPEYPKDFHVGFFVETPDEVDQMYRRLQEVAGIEIDSEPRNMRGGYTIYFRALDGILFEITYLDKAS